MKNHRFSILMGLLVLVVGLGLGCRKSSNDLDDPEACNSPFTAIPCTSIEGVGQTGSPSMPGGEEPMPTQTRRQME